jgi:hypothetical protein
LVVEGERGDAAAFFAGFEGAVFGRALAAFFGVARAGLAFAFGATLAFAFGAGLAFAFGAGLAFAFGAALLALAAPRIALRGGLFFAALRGSTFFERTDFFLLDFLAAMVAPSLARVRARLRPSRNERTTPALRRANDT